MEGNSVFLIDQELLPFQFRILECRNHRETVGAIRNMNVRGAGAIGAAAGYAMAQAFHEQGGNSGYIQAAKSLIESARPTAQNLFYAVQRVFDAGTVGALAAANAIAKEDADACREIGKIGSELIRDGCRLATHCNAGWLAFVDHGSALSPVYAAHASGKKVFVFVDETRPRGQGARLTAWELKNEGIPHAIIPDNAFAFYAAAGKIDLVIVGADRVAANGDTANKIGTLEKAIIAREYGIPFYVAAPVSTFDKQTATGEGIVIEERGEEEVTMQSGPDETGTIRRIRVASPDSPVFNPAFDITPARLITAYITEKGITETIDPGWF